VKHVIATILTTGLLTTGIGCSIMFGQTPNKKPANVSKSEQQVRGANQAWAEAITKSDAKALDRLFAEDIVVTSGSGVVRTKAEEIKDAAGGATDPDFSLTRPFTTEDVRVKVYDDAAIVTGLAKWAFRYKGQDVNQERRYTHAYIKDRGQWRIVAQQVSSNLYKKPPATP
jgi:ketosteroid isomerase-like protein